MIPGVVFSGGWDGILRAFSAEDGNQIWEVNTAQDYKTVNGVKSNGGSMAAPGPTPEIIPLPERFSPPNAVGGTPLVTAGKLAAHWGLKNLFFKNDAVCFPSLSFKDRVVATALVAARRFGFQTVGCSSTGNLANAVAAQAAQQGFDACVFIPADLEPAKVLNTAVYGARIVRINGNYDHVNRLCAQIADRFKWGLVNVNLRP